MLHLLRYEPDAEEALHRLLTNPRFATLAERVETELQAIASDPGSAKGRSGQLRLPIRGHTVWRTRVSGSGEVRVVLWMRRTTVAGRLERARVGALRDAEPLQRQGTQMLLAAYSRCLLFWESSTPTPSSEAARAVEGLGVLFGQSENRLVQDCGLPEDLADRFAGLVGRATAVAFELDRLEQSGIKTLGSWDLLCVDGLAGASDRRLPSRSRSHWGPSADARSRLQAATGSSSKLRIAMSGGSSGVE